MRRFSPRLPFFPTRSASVLLALGAGLCLAVAAPAQPPAPAPSPEPPPATPAPTADAATPAPTPDTSPTSMEASFDFSQGVILLDVDLSGGHVVKLALDTGDEGSVLDATVADEIKVPADQLLSNLIPKGKGPDVSTPQISMDDLRIGTAQFTGKPFLIVPIKADLAAMGITCQGTIGYRFFEEKVVQIDYPAHRLRMLPAAPSPSVNAIVLPIQWKQSAKLSPALITTDQLKIGDHALVAQFDTLFARTLLLYTPKLPWLETRRLPQIPPAYYEHGVLRPALPLMPIALGNHAFAQTPPAYLADKDALVPETDISAVLGNGFFLDTVVTLDYKHDQMIVEWKD